MKKINQKQIAKRLGVSQTTISIVLNDPGTERVSKERRDRVLSYLNDISYQATFRKTGNIGHFLSPDVDMYYPYYHRFLSGTEEGLKAYKKHVIVVKWDGDFTILMQKKVDGVIINVQMSKEEIRKILNFVPAVLLNYALDEPMCDMVMPDNIGAVKNAVIYLYNKNHRRIAFFGVFPPAGEKSIHLSERLEGYQKGMMELGLPAGEEYVQIPERIVGGIEEVDRYASEVVKSWQKLRNPPTAVVCANDGYAISLINMALVAKIKIPDELSVIGFDNMVSCNHTHPRLTSINQNMEEMGKIAAELLISRIENENNRPWEKIICGTEIVERESVKEIRVGGSH